MEIVNPSTLDMELNKDIGDEITYSNQEQKYPVSFSQYKQLILNVDVFKNQQDYQQFISLMNTTNTTFFKTFFDLILGKDALADYSNIAKAKKALDQSYQLFYKSLESIKKSKIPTENPVSLVLLRDYPFIPAAVTLVEFANRFITALSEIQSTLNYLNQYKQFLFMSKPSSATLYQPKKINKIQYQGQVIPNRNNRLSQATISKTTTVDTNTTTVQQNQNLVNMKLKGESNYHTYMPFNMNSIVFSFLNAEELKQLYLTDRIFRAQIPQILEGISIKSVHRFEEIKANLKVDEKKLLEIDEDISEAQKYKFDKGMLQELISYPNPCAGVDCLFYIIFNVFSDISEGAARKKKNQLFQKYSKVLIDFSEIINLNKKRLDILKNYSYSQMDWKSSLEKVSPITLRIFLNLRALAKIYDAGFKDKDQWRQFSQARLVMNEMTNLQQYLIK